MGGLEVQSCILYLFNVAPRIVAAFYYSKRKTPSAA